MLIKESTFRRILREEARRVLREQTGAPTASGGATGAISDVLWKILGDSGFPKTHGKVMVAINNLPKQPTLVAKMRPYLGDTSATRAAIMINCLHSFFYKPLQQIDFSSGAGLTDAEYNFATTEGKQSASAEVSQNYQNYIKKATAHGAEFMTKLKSYVDGIPDPAAAPTAAAKQHTIAKGDTISGILQRYYGIPLSKKNVALYKEFATLNGIPNPDQITPGKTLTLPSRVGTFPLK
jgi:nucleoid-associated protein YgaU